MKVVVLGDGLLGSEIVSQTNWNCISRKKDNIDAKDFKSWSNLLDGYDTIVNCIAFTKTYDNNKVDNWNLNIIFVDELVEYCNQNNKKLIHISTDYLYAGSVPNATEDDVPIPINTWYGYSKLVGDALVQLRSKDYLICRLSHKPNPFPYESAWSDIHTNCDSVDVISNLVIRLIEKKSTGVFNVGTEVKSIYEVAKRSNESVRPINKPSHVPNDISMNINKLNNKLIKK
jgi:nucleoside-diphosphate-sugar epimerase